MSDSRSKSYAARKCLLCKDGRNCINGKATKFTKTFNPNSQMGKSLTALAISGMIPSPSSKKKTSGKTFQLNPLYVEEMMGFPLMWTALPFLSLNGEQNQ